MECVGCLGEFGWVIPKQLCFLESVGFSVVMLAVVELMNDLIERIANFVDSRGK